MVFEKEVSNKIKGIAALCVMLSHYFNRNEIVPPLCMISDGALWVGIFFLFSGFGLERSYQRKDNYLEGFFRKKIVKIYLPFLLAETVYTLAALYKGEKLSLIEVILGCSGILLKNTVLWYVWHILGCYIIFAVVKKWVTEKWQSGLWMVLYIGYLGLCVLLDVGNWWYISTFPFLMGLWIAGHQEQFEKGIAKRKGLLTILFWGLFALLQLAEYGIWVFPYIPTGFWITGIRLCLSPVLVMWMAMVMNELSHKENKSKTAQKRNPVKRAGDVVLSGLGQISYEIYLWHVTVMYVFGEWIKIYNPYGKAIVYSCLTIVVALLFSRLRFGFKRLV